MALGAFWNQPVLVVADRAVDSTVPAWCFAPGRVRHFVADPAGSRSGIRNEDYFERGVSRVALQACDGLLFLKMWLMTFETRGDGAMPIGMALCTLQVSVGAGVLLQVCRLFLVAFEAEVCQLITGRDQQGAVRVGVAGSAVAKCLSVGKTVAIAALGHQLGPVIFTGIIGMKFLVATLAVELVPASGLFEISILGAVALAALNRGEGWRFGTKGGGNATYRGSRQQENQQE